MIRILFSKWIEINKGGNFFEIRANFQPHRITRKWAKKIDCLLFQHSFTIPFFQGKTDGLENDVLNLTSPDRYELSWFIPEDNGEMIDFFEVSFYPVTYDPSSMTWKRRGDLFRTGENLKSLIDAYF